jgi:ribosomal protein RSM22 (predicted rRNA methylase)
MRKFTYLSIISHQFLINFSLSNKHSSGGRRNKGKERKKEKKEEKKREREREIDLDMFLRRLIGLKRRRSKNTVSNRYNCTNLICYSCCFKPSSSSSSYSSSSSTARSKLFSAKTPLAAKDIEDEEDIDIDIDDRRSFTSQSKWKTNDNNDYNNNIEEDKKPIIVVENQWKRMLREAGEQVIPTQLLLRTTLLLSQQRLKQQGNNERDDGLNDDDEQQQIPAKAIVNEANRLTNRKGFNSLVHLRNDDYDNSFPNANPKIVYDDDDDDNDDYNNNSNDDSSNMANNRTLQLPKHFEKAIKKAIQSEGSSNKQLARKGKNLLEVLKTASRGFPEDDLEDEKVKGWLKKRDGVANDSAIESYTLDGETSGEDDDDDEMIKREWDADIDWAARLSVRKLRRMQMEDSTFISKATTRTSAKKTLGNVDVGRILQTKEQRHAPRYDQTEAAAYAVTRSPMTLGAITNVLNEIHLKLNGGSLHDNPSFSPETLLDFGSGSVFVGPMAARSVFGKDKFGFGKGKGKGKKSAADNTTTAAAVSDKRVKFAAVDKSSHGMVFAKRVESYMRDEEENEDNDDEKEDEDADKNNLLIEWSDDTFVPKRNNRRFPTPEAWSDSTNFRSVASLAALQDKNASAFDLVLACYSLGEVMIEAENEERRVKSGISSSKHSSGANKTFGMRKVDLLARQLWDKTANGGILVIIEPGTPRGSALVRRIRQLILDYEDRHARSQEKRLDLKLNSVQSNAHVVAPCQHDKKCPMSVANEQSKNSQMWCHFSQRVERTSMHRLMLARGKGRTYQDESFSYVAIQKLSRNEAEELSESKALRILENNDAEEFAVSNGAQILGERDDEDEDEDEDDEEDEFNNNNNNPSSSVVVFDKSTKQKAKAIAVASQSLWSRVVRVPIRRRGHVIIETCEPSGELHKRTVAKSHGSVFGIGRDGYRRARKTTKGDLFAFEDFNKQTTTQTQATESVVNENEANYDDDDDDDENMNKSKIEKKKNSRALFDEEEFIKEWLSKKE